MGQCRRRGVSLVETMVAAALCAIAMATAAPSFSSLLERRRLEGLAAEVAADLQFVRSEAVSRNHGVRMSFEQATDGSTCYVIHLGSTGSCTCLSGVSAHCSAGALELKTQYFPAANALGVRANVGSVLYDPVFGTVSPTMTVRVGRPDRPGVHHVVNILGRVRTCVPAGGPTGYPPC